MSDKYNFGTIRLKNDTIEYLKALKDAFEVSYGTKLTMDEFMRRMADTVNGGDNRVWEVFCIQKSQKEELLAKIQESDNFYGNEQS